MSDMRTAIAYVDGFNFYYGVMKDSPEWKWLDLQAFCERLVRGYNLLRVNYYTARVSSSEDDPGQHQRQDDYLRALATRPKVEIIHGQFQRNLKRVTLTDGRRESALVYEEKGSDVNLGTDLSWDAAEKRMQSALVISNDFDLQRPIKRAMGSGIEVIVVNPHQRRNRKPSVRGNDVRKIHTKVLRDSQLPSVVLGLDGQQLHRPPSWT